MLGAEVGTEIHNLPSPETNQQPRGADAEPLDTVVGALVGIAQLLLTKTQVLHLVNNLGRQLLNAAQVCLDGLELLLGLDGGPVTGVGANIDIELNSAGRGVRATVYSCMVNTLGLQRESHDRVKLASRHDVLVANVESGIGVRRKDRLGVTDDISGVSVLVANLVADLSPS